MSTIVKGKFTKEIFLSNDGNFRLTAFNVSEIIEQDNNFVLNKFKSVSLRTEKFEIEYNKIYKITLIDLKNSRYPNTYAIDQIEETKDTDKAYILKFLSSSAYKGIGLIKAQNIIDTFGLDVLDKIKEKKLKHTDLNISQETYDNLSNDLKNNEAATKLRLFIYECGLSDTFYGKLIQSCPASQFYKKYQDNPWPLYFELKNVTFSDIFKIAVKLKKDDLAQKNEVLVFDILNTYLFDSGNTKIPIANLLMEVRKKESNISQNDFFEALDELIEAKKVIKLNSLFVEPMWLYEQEKYIVTRLKYLKKHGDKNPLQIKVSKLDSVQKKAVELALQDTLSLITGAPGTGKTLVTNEIIKQLRQQYKEEDIAVVTPTGRATININKHNIIKASTIHSLLKWDTEGGYFGIKEESLSIKVLIIDEFSMVSTDLFYYLLFAINRYDLKKIILVGDKDQLPAIGSGYLINDFIKNEITNTIFLEKNYRQNENFEIIEDAKKINESQIPDFKGNRSSFIEVETSQLANIIINKIQQLHQQGYTKKDIAILSPIYKYQTGIDNLNEKIQDFYKTLENQKPYKIFSRTVYINDKVINLENDPNKNIFNGEIGYIEKISQTNANSGQILFIFVVFEGGKTISYTPSEFIKKTMLAYCTSVHKYQGSESEIVLTVLFNEAKTLLSKKLIYTAITRAKSYSFIYGQKSALEIGIKNDKDSRRSTSIQKLWEKL
ncbi:AAA family ATPase [Mycoplasma miroungirhinis]|uniref:AAA family ATPase n=1 Tax=Mycoplasma miroungirhinis TaxID=754516 RepID=A0A6M4JE12_9MOLU|nr:AAA family ATPase [Mycoplasma miroungirhinis]QJR44327.1 AAA family ATPase [Mycoplasma miroungirhinis]